MANLSIRDVKKSFGRTDVLHGLNLDVAEGEFVALVGPSGCGKSTLLRILAGLDEPSDGDVLIDGDWVNDRSPKERKVAMVFQSYALYPHMNVAQNIGFNLRISGVSKSEIQQRVEQTAKMLDLDELLDRKPSQLSGGQRQRVAMGRALVRNPDVFLFDEPLSNLDAKLRVQMRDEIKRLHQKVRTTSVYVTHDQIEAMTLADRVVILNQGRIEQIGTPTELYREPVNAFVAGFIGTPSMNFIDANVHSVTHETSTSNSTKTHSQTNSNVVTKTKLNISSDVTLCSYRNKEASLAGHVRVGIRPEHMRIISDSAQGEPQENKLTGIIEMVEPTGAQNHIKVQTGNTVLTVVDTELNELKEGDQITLTVSPKQVYVFDEVNSVH